MLFIRKPSFWGCSKTRLVTKQDVLLPSNFTVYHIYDMLKFGKKTVRNEKRWINMLKFIVFDFLKWVFWKETSKTKVARVWNWNQFEQVQWSRVQASLKKSPKKGPYT